MSRQGNISRLYPSGRAKDFPAFVVLGGGYIEMLQASDITSLEYIINFVNFSCFRCFGLLLLSNQVRECLFFFLKNVLFNE